MTLASSGSSSAARWTRCIVDKCARAGFYAENLLLYSKYAQDKAKLPLPMGSEHKIAPVALGDVALLAAHIVTSTGEHGLGDNVQGQLITMTGTPHQQICLAMGADGTQVPRWLRVKSSRRLLPRAWAPRCNMKRYQSKKFTRPEYRDLDTDIKAVMMPRIY
jgi:hypothetical protein